MVSSPCCPPCGLGGASQCAPPRSCPGQQKASGGEIRTPLGHQLTVSGGGGAAEGKERMLFDYIFRCLQSS